MVVLNWAMICVWLFTDKVISGAVLLNWAQAFAVTALCQAALGNTEKAKEELDSSEKALSKVRLTADYADLSRWKYLFQESAELLEGVTNGNGTTPEARPKRSPG